MKWHTAWLLLLLVAFPTSAEEHFERDSDLDAMVAQLRAAEIAVEVDPQDYPNGRFARLYDPEGNPIELWEPK